jgi:hypothetical protein
VSSASTPNSDGSSSTAGKVVRVSCSTLSYWWSTENLLEFTLDLKTLVAHFAIKNKERAFEIVEAQALERNPRFRRG